MGKIKEKADCETLWMEFDYEKHSSPQILIGDGGDNYISIILKKHPQYVHVWATEKEVDIIIEALQEAKEKFLKNKKYPLKMVRPSDTYNPIERWGYPGLFAKTHPHFQETTIEIANSEFEEKILRNHGYKLL
jgi:hypothetical protein